MTKFIVMTNTTDAISLTIKAVEIIFLLAETDSLAFLQMVILEQASLLADSCYVHDAVS